MTSTLPARAEVVVLGGGLTGLAAAARLVARGATDVAVLEAAPRVGGLLWTWQAEGVAIDHLPHVWFSQDADAEVAFRGAVGEVHEHRSRLGVRWAGGYVGFPFQHHLAELPLDTRRALLTGLLAERGQPLRAVRTLEDLSLARLGRGLTEAFFRPYNEKLWRTPLRAMSADWLGAKIRLPDAGELADGLLGLDTPPRAEVAPHARFLYPKAGGIESLARGLAAQVGEGRIHVGVRARRIDPARRVLDTDAGPLAYGHLITTLPLAGVPGLLPLPRAARVAAARMRATRVVGVQLVLDRVNLPDLHWIYLPERHLPCYRLTRVDCINPHVAGGRPALIAEVATAAGDRTRPDTWACRVRDALAAEGILRPADLRLLRARAFWPAYPVPHVGIDADRRRLEAALRVRGVVPAGRFGTWRFQNMDHAMRAGWGAADEVLAP